ncbi:hypothetical protein KAFR_0C04360 [Kazachstania africana CBS 2517]|uniref:Cullin family profile domain-containing protein n=1 Tax=Kazachstania africana (strain ATCC 22294 / BCRC 22015 / CBS 2517 / CECT 1963 / NBRC 1671 / NRRL Y-8276) TaxID=1071382 RepID=H2ASS6_KAZAF|nr:hypothetical protein KAFR_0C04360 [Kazachstania africana CBS 2517]CCF57426.1 hypothetical protein KAFR_0C04360 [Kazachstania africana CBS 2517]
MQSLCDEDAKNILQFKQLVGELSNEIGLIPSVKLAKLRSIVSELCLSKVDSNLKKMVDLLFNMVLEALNNSFKEYIRLSKSEQQSASDIYFQLVDHIYYVSTGLCPLVYQVKSREWFITALRECIISFEPTEDKLNLNLLYKELYQNYVNDNSSKSFWKFKTIKELIEQIISDDMNNGNFKSYPILEDLIRYCSSFFEKYLRSVKSSKKGNFFDILKIWRRTLQVMELFGDAVEDEVRKKNLKLIITDLEFMFDSLRGVRLQNNFLDIVSLNVSKLSLQANYEKIFLRERRIKYDEDDLNNFVDQVYLTDSLLEPQTTELMRSLKTKLRNQFKAEIKDIDKYHLHLSRFLQRLLKPFSYPDNQKTRLLHCDRRTETIIPILLFYTPELGPFIEKHYFPMLMRRLLIANTSFLDSFNHPSNFESILCNNLPPDLQRKMRHILNVISAEIEASNNVPRNGQMITSTFFFNQRLFDFELPCSAPIWINSDLKKQWNYKIEKLKTEGKILRNTGLHFIEMGSPFLDERGREITIKLSHSAAAVLNVFNDIEEITIPDLLNRLDVTKGQKTNFNKSLEALIGSGLLLRNGNKITYNKDYIPNDLVKKTGILKL